MSQLYFEDFRNRLRKMDRHIGKWARRKDIHCYRIYDADIPGFPFSIDRYEDFIYVAEYQGKKNHAADSFPDGGKKIRETICSILGISDDYLFYKERKPQKGKQQYEKYAEEQQAHVVREGGLKFWVNLRDYLDTGLFLDHRNTRSLVREKAAGARVLNLFAYTGSFTVYAAAGKASNTLSIDLSNTYLEWARRNLLLNRLDAPQHQYLWTDVLDWLRKPVSSTFDLIILDPPTFSNSKRMNDILDIQRDHPFLIKHCMDRLSPDGTLYFSTNFKKFRLDIEQIRGIKIRDISGQTVPNDFQNNRIHQCFEIRH